MNQIHKFTSNQKLQWWGYGEWVEEPDLVTFEHHGIECKIQRTSTWENPDMKHNFGGNLCGYVAIPKGHPYYLKDYGEINIDVHYGLTWSKLEEDGNYWIGFDCAHCYDLVPSLQKDMLYCKNFQELKALFTDPPEFKELALFNPVYRNLAFCIEECKSMAEQVVASTHLSEEPTT